jgi:hypothetical protein
MTWINVGVVIGALACVATITVGGGKPVGVAEFSLGVLAHIQ